MEVLTTLLLPIILGLIASVTSIVVALIGNHKTNRKIDEQSNENELNSIRNQILILLMEDRISINEGKVPSNYQSICYLFDKYNEKGGNSYVKTKVQHYFNIVEGLSLEED